MAVPPSPTLAVNERVRRRREAGEPILHLAFGEAGLPVLPELGERLGAAAGDNAYPAVAGLPSLRTAAAGYFERRGLPTHPDQIVAAPGSKPLLYALLSALPGDVVLPRPCWVSYAAQAALAGRQIAWADIPPDSGGVPDPDALREALARARGEGQRPGVLVLTLPDNPTGALADRQLLEAVCEIAMAERLAIVSDEIYRDLVHGDEPVTSPAELAPEATFVTGGLSKSVALGGWRVGFARFPDSPLGAEVEDAVVGLASEVWSGLCAPMQHVAAWVLEEPPAIREHVAAARRLHGTVVEAAHRIVLDAGASCRAPRGGFYLYPDLEPWREALGVASGEALAERLLDDHGVAVLAGAAFGDDPRALRFRIATSLLFGDGDEQRWTALLADDPLALPWVRGGLEHLEGALRALAP